LLSRAIETARRRIRICFVLSVPQLTPEGMSGMNPIDLIVTVCAVLSPATCEETHLVFNWNGSLQQCAMRAPPYIAKWVEEHPKWNAVRWRCEYPRSNDRAGRVEVGPAG
jgi:hypothetical protein